MINKMYLGRVKILRGFILCSVFSLLLASCLSAEIKREWAEPIIISRDYPEGGEEQAFRQAKLWVAENFDSAKTVITYEDIELGEIRGSGNRTIDFFGGMVKLRFKIAITVKSGKATLKVTDIEIWQQSNDIDGAYSWSGPLSDAYIKMKQNLAEELEAIFLL